MFAPSQFFNKYDPWEFAPPTSDFRLVFRYNYKIKSFDFTKYSASSTDGKLSRAELQSFLEKLNSIVNTNMPKDVSSIACLCVFLLAVIMVAIVIPIIAVNADGFNTGAAFGVSLGILFVVFMIVAYSIFRKNRKNHAKISAMKSEAQRLIADTRLDFKPRGLRWSIPPEFPLWVELWKDYKADHSSQFRFEEIHTRMQEMEINSPPDSTLKIDILSKLDLSND